MKKIKDPEISKEKFRNFDEVKTKLDKNLWIDFINSNSDYFTWFEDTQEGINLKNNLDKVPKDFMEKTLSSLNKTRVYAEYNKKKKFFEVTIYFSIEYGIIYTTFQKKITKKHLYKLLEMANYLDALLLNNGTQIIDEKVIEDLEKNSK